MIVLQGHHSRVSALAYSPDGRLLATGACDRAIRIWDLATGDERRAVGPTPMPLRGVVWSLDGTLVFSVGRARTIQAWDARSGELQGTFSEREARGDTVLDLIGRPSPEEDDPARLHHAEATAWRLSFAMASRSTSEHAEDSQTRTYYDFPLEAWTLPLRLESGQAFDRCWIPMTARGTRLGAHLPGAGVTTAYLHGLIAFTPDDQRMALTWDGKITLWDVQNRHEIQVFDGHAQAIRSLAFSPDGQTLVSGARDGVVCLWSLRDDCEPARFDWEIGEIEAVAFAPDGATAAAGGRQGIIVWDLDEEVWV